MGKLITLGTSVLFIALMFSGFIYVLGDFQLGYNFNAPANYSNLVTAFNATATADQASSQRNALNTSVNDPFSLSDLPVIGAGFNFLDIAGKRIGSVISVFTASGDIFGQMLEAGSEALGIPTWITYVFITAITLAILIFIASWILGREV